MINYYFQVSFNLKANLYLSKITQTSVTGLLCLRSAHTRATRADWSSNKSRRQVPSCVNWPFLLQNLAAGTNFVPSNQFEVLGQVPATSLLCKLFTRLVTWTSPLVTATFNYQSVKSEEILVQARSEHFRKSPKKCLNYKRRRIPREF